MNTQSSLDIIEKPDDDQSLLEFENNMYLTNNEKAYRLRELADVIARDEIDEDMLDYLGELNMNPHLCTTKCCGGHGDGTQAYVDIRTDFEFEELWKRVYQIIHNYEATPCSMSVYGELGMPRFCFWLTNEKRDVTIKALIDALK